MSYYKPKPILISTSLDTIAFNVGKETRDSYTIITTYYHSVNTDEVSNKSLLVKNDIYSDLPRDKSKIDITKKYREEIFIGTLKGCVSTMQEIIDTQGYWDRDPKTFRELFIEPIK